MSARAGQSAGVRLLTWSNALALLSVYSAKFNSKGDLVLDKVVRRVLVTPSECATGCTFALESVQSATKAVSGYAGMIMHRISSLGPSESLMGETEGIL